MTEPAHLKRGPSGASRWLICTDSPEAEEGYPDETSDAADEGTAAHWLLEQCLLAGQNCQEWVDDAVHKDNTPTVQAGSLGPTILGGEESGCLKDWPITGEMIEAVQTHITAVEKHSTKRGTKTFVEERVHVGEHFGLSDTVGGTADTIMWLPKSKTLCVYDFKYGKGHVVEVGSDKWCVNPQIGLYAIAAMSELKRLLKKDVQVKWIELAIIQPRAYHKKGPVRIKKISPMQLMDLEMDLIEAVNGPRVRVPGEHCYFCRAKPDCAEYHAHRGEQATGGFEAEMPEYIAAGHAGDEPWAEGHGERAGTDVTPVDQQYPLGSVPELISRPVKGLTLEELAKARAVLGPLKAWAKEVEEEVRTRWLHDMPVPGTRLAQGPGSRSFGGDPLEIEAAALKTAEATGVSPSDLYEPTELKSPAKLEKQLGKAKFKASPLASLVSYQAGGPVVVDEDSDKPDYVKDGGFEAEVPPDPIDSPLL